MRYDMIRCNASSAAFCRIYPYQTLKHLNDRLAKERRKQIAKSSDAVAHEDARILNKSTAEMKGSAAGGKGRAVQSPSSPRYSREAVLKRKEEREWEKQKAECTFKPKTRTILRKESAELQNKRKEDVFNHLYHAGQKFFKDREQMILQGQKSPRNCTFAPKINSRGSRGGVDQFERLYHMCAFVSIVACTESAQSTSWLLNSDQLRLICLNVLNQ